MLTGSGDPGAPLGWRHAFPGCPACPLPTAHSHSLALREREPLAWSPVPSAVAAHRPASPAVWRAAPFPGQDSSGGLPSAPETLVGTTSQFSSSCQPGFPLTHCRRHSPEHFSVHLLAICPSQSVSWGAQAKMLIVGSNNTCAKLNELYKEVKLLASQFHFIETPLRGAVMEAVAP